MCKIHRQFVRSLFAFVSLALAWAVSCADDVPIRQFDDASGLTGWRFDYGGVTHTMVFEPSQDADNNLASGSMKVTFGFDAAALNPSGNNKGAITIDLPTPLDGSEYLTLEMDLKIETGSAADGAGNSGYFQMVIRNTGNYNFNSQFGANVTTNSGWRHISVVPNGARDNIRAITLELYGGAGLTGPVTLYVDNVKFTKPGPTSDIFVSRFDSASSQTGWRFDYGGVTNLIVFDASQDASNNPASGSLKTTFGFNASLAGNNVGALTYDLPSPISAVDYLLIEMDVKVAPGSAADGAGDSGSLQVVLRTTSFYDVDSQLTTSLRASNGWPQLRSSPLTGQIDDIHAITLELAGNVGLTGPVTFYIDNLKFTKTAAPTPGPTLGIERPVRGLNLIPAAGQYERQSISTVNSSGLGWFNASQPVTYAVTIRKYPDASHNGFQTHLFLVSSASGTDSAPDYNQPNVVFLDIQNRADGTAAAAFRYRVNEPAGNSFLYGAGTLGTFNSPSPVGTWSLTFTQNTNATVTAPAGATATFTLPSAAAALFADPLTVYVGAQANTAANIGQKAVLSRVTLTRGATAVIDDDFSTDQALNALWQVAAGTP